jgi:hypothetical protein
MASRTGANGVDIDGRHQFIDYSLWQASRFDWCSDVDGEPTRIGDSLRTVSEGDAHGAAGTF